MSLMKMKDLPYNRFEHYGHLNERNKSECLSEETSTERKTEMETLKLLYSVDE